MTGHDQKMALEDGLTHVFLIACVCCTGSPGPPSPGPPAPGPPATGPVTHTVGGKCRNVGVAGGFGICISDCAGDSDCTGGDLCCQNECGGQVCSAPCPVLTCPVQCDVFSNGENGCPTCSCDSKL